MEPESTHPEPLPASARPKEEGVVGVRSFSALKVWLVVLALCVPVGWLLYDSAPFFRDQVHISEHVLAIARDNHGVWSTTRRDAERSGFVVRDDRDLRIGWRRFWIEQREPLLYPVRMKLARASYLPRAAQWFFLWSPEIAQVVVRESNDCIDKFGLAGIRAMQTSVTLGFRVAG